MYALSLELADDQRASFPDFFPVIHVDRAVQVEEAQLEAAPEEAELRSMPLNAPAASSSASRFSPHPRRSGGASPWLLPVDDSDDSDGGDDGGEEDEDDGALEEAPAASEAGASSNLELAQASFLAGHNKGELVAGSIGFYRYEQPAGVFGLRPPPLRSNVVCIMAVPSWLSSSDLLHFIGGYTRYARHMRLLRDLSMPNRNMLLVQFASPSVAERFRADYHAKVSRQHPPPAANASSRRQHRFASTAPPAPALTAATALHAARAGPPRPHALDPAVPRDRTSAHRTSAHRTSA
jgi:hypothetical protein